jgi:hypothetical protein
VSHLQVLDADAVGKDDVIGELVIDLAKVYEHGDWYDIEDRFRPLLDPENHVSADAKVQKVRTMLKQAFALDARLRLGTKSDHLLLRTVKCYQIVASMAHAFKEDKGLVERLNTANQRLFALLEENSHRHEWLEHKLAASLEAPQFDVSDHGLGTIRTLIQFEPSLDAGGNLESTSSGRTWLDSSLVPAPSPESEPVDSPGTNTAVEQTDADIIVQQGTHFKTTVQIRVLQCDHLVPDENNHTTSDPYVRLAAGTKPVGGKWVHKTSVKKEELCPRWSEENVFSVVVEADATGAATGQLHLQVMEWDKIGKDDFLGEVSVDLAMIMSEGDDAVVEWEGSLLDPEGKVSKKGVAKRRKMLESGEFGGAYSDSGYGKIKIELTQGFG